MGTSAPISSIQGPPNHRRPLPRAFQNLGNSVDCVDLIFLPHAEIDGTVAADHRGRTWQPRGRDHPFCRAVRLYRVELTQTANINRAVGTDYVWLVKTLSGVTAGRGCDN